MKLIRTENLSFEYPSGVLALDRIDLEIKPNIRPEKIVLFTNISVGDAP